jgi:hypothetical protein
MADRRTIAVGIALLLSSILLRPLLAKDADKTEKRARPPKWPKEVLDVFFEDARTKLVGERPDYGAATVEVASRRDAATVGAVSDRRPNDSGAAWSKVIDATTLETEIKRLSQALDKNVTTPGKFKAGGYEDCRRDFSTLAAMFALAAEYDGDVRWQDSAAGLRELFARAGHNCKVGNDQTFREASQRKQDLADLISGSRPTVPQAEKTAAWAKVADRPPLMQRLEIAHEERLTKWLANEREFKRNSDAVRHEAQLVAAIADIIGREGFDYWDEEEYAANAKALREAATEISAAVEAENFEAAQRAVGNATKACAACHELYRG